MKNCREIKNMVYTIIRLCTYEYVNIKRRRLSNTEDRIILHRAADINNFLFFLVALVNVTKAQ